MRFAYRELAWNDIVVDDNQPVYPTQSPDPTPQEIADSCARIQAGWTDTERRKRTAVHPRRWELPEVTHHNDPR